MHRCPSATSPQGKCIKYASVLLKETHLRPSLLLWLLMPALGLALFALNSDELSEKIRIHVFADVSQMLQSRKQDVTTATFLNLCVYLGWIFFSYLFDGRLGYDCHDLEVRKNKYLYSTGCAQLLVDLIKCLLSFQPFIWRINSCSVVKLEWIQGN